MKVLLTGATGYLGSHLARYFLQKGHHLIILKRSFSNIDRITDIFDKLVSFDIDKINLDMVFNKVPNIDIVIHTAVNYGRNKSGVTNVFDSNVQFPLELLKISINNNVKVFINTDSYFSSEGVRLKYLEEYILSKRTFLEWARKYASNNIKLINMRLEHVYGPNESISKFTSWIVNECRVNATNINLSSGIQKRDFIYIDDVVEAYEMVVLKSDLLHVEYVEIGVGTGVATKVKDFVIEVHTITKSKSKIFFKKKPLRENEIMKSKANNDKLKSLGWNAKYTLAEGIAKVINTDNN
jgi:CDP-paratose synthetase